MEQLVEVARVLREVHGFGGYIHLKSAPGVAKELLDQAGKWADRLSVNVELPTPAALADLAPEKTMSAIEASMSVIAQSKKQAIDEGRPQAFAPAGQSTQLIVGASDSTDRDLLTTSHHLYTSYKLRRVYYSAFSPIPHGDLRLPAKSPPLIREHRLYEADWLVRFYGFDVHELVPEDRPTLNLEMDPKLAWALSHREIFPVDINRAPRESLLRVPGLGLGTVAKILAARRHRSLRREHLPALRVARRALPFLVAADDVTTAARNLDRTKLQTSLVKPVQIELFAARASAVSGEL